MILVIGGHTGIGFSAAEMLRGQGHSLVVTTSKSRSQAEGNLQPNVMELDLGSRDSIKEFSSTFLRLGSKLTGIVFCSAIPFGKRIGFAGVDDLQGLFQINLFGFLDLLQRILRGIADGCSIVVVSSHSSASPIVGNAWYGMTKASLDRFVASAALELKSRRIRINSVAPTLVETDMLRQMSSEGKAAVLASSHSDTALSPRQVAHVISFLLEDRSSAINGQTLHLGHYV
jgi:enoyl-[acyl-carrier protein] reductase III